MEGERDVVLEEKRRKRRVTWWRGQGEKRVREKIVRVRMGATCSSCCLRAKIYFSIWSLKRSTYDNVPIIIGGPIKRPPAKIDFCMRS